jgi:hypothetical protein
LSLPTPASLSVEDLETRWRVAALQHTPLFTSGWLRSPALSLLGGRAKGSLVLCEYRSAYGLISTGRLEAQRDAATLPSAGLSPPELEDPPGPGEQLEKAVLLEEGAERLPNAERFRGSRPDVQATPRARPRLVALSAMAQSVSGASSSLPRTARHDAAIVAFLIVTPSLSRGNAAASGPRPADAGAFLLRNRRASTRAPRRGYWYVWCCRRSCVHCSALSSRGKAASISSRGGISRLHLTIVRESR